MWQRMIQGGTKIPQNAKITVNEQDKENGAGDFYTRYWDKNSSIE